MLDMMSKETIYPICFAVDGKLDHVVFHKGHYDGEVCTPQKDDLFVATYTLWDEADPFRDKQVGDRLSFGGYKWLVEARDDWRRIVLVRFAETDV